LHQSVVLTTATRDNNHILSQLEVNIGEKDTMLLEQEQKLLSLVNEIDGIRKQHEDSLIHNKSLTDQISNLQH
jgi:hypothetical protein